MYRNIKQTFTQLVNISCVSKFEDKIAKYVIKRLRKLGLSVRQDKIGNVIGFLPGEGESILLSAHLDRVPPGKTVNPKFSGSIVKSDGSTNLGADNAAGITVILQLLEYFTKKDNYKPALEVIFTVQEEIGLFGARALKVKDLKSKSGIILDNAFDAGVVVEQGCSFFIFDIEILGKSVHSGKNLTDGVNALQVLLKSGIELGELDKGASRVNIGIVESGTMRNVVPDKVLIKGELRSFLQGAALKNRQKAIINSFSKAATKIGAKLQIKKSEIPGYKINSDNEILLKYQEVIEKNNQKFIKKRTFVGSDANALIGIHNLDVFVISTGVKNEHTVNETVDLKDLDLIIKNLTETIKLHC